MKKLTVLLIIITTCFVTESLSQCSTTNLAQGKTVTATTQDVNHTATLVADGSLTTYWWPSGGSADVQSLTIDLGQNYTVCQAKVTWEDQNHAAGTYKVQYSTDNLTYTDAASITGNSSAIVTHSVGATARYIRLAMTLRYVNWSSYSVKEIEVFSNSSNQLPTVSITAPANSAAFSTGSNVVINANAADADGTISKVEFYQGATKLGEDLVTPYTYTWNNVSAGSYALTAVATDNSTGATTSAAVNIIVSTPAASSDWSLTGNATTTPGTNFLGTTDNQRLIFKTFGTERMTVLGSGYVGINTVAPSSELAVNGTITTKKIKVTQLGWADYVFEKSYRLMSLSELEIFIQRFKHLPEVPSAGKVAEQGVDIGDVQALLLKKIEELTLYVIEQNKKLEKQQQQLKQQDRAIKALKKPVAIRK